MRYVRTILGYLYLLIATPVLGTSVIVLAFLGDRTGRLWWKSARLWAWGLIKVLGVSELVVVGGERIEALEAGLVMSNHESHVDPPALILAAPKTPLRFLAKKELAKFPIFGQALWAMGMVFIDRKNQASAFESIELAAKRIREGKVVLIFPEGTRSRSGAFQSFKKGGFVIAAKSHVPIVPVGIAGSRQVLPPGWWVRSPGPVVLVIGEPIDTTPYTLENKEELMALVHERISALRKEAHRIRIERFPDASPSADPSRFPED